MHWTTKFIPDMTGKTVIITGANCGIGFETAKAFGNKNATVILACQNPVRTQSALKRLQPKRNKNFYFISALDLSDINSIKNFADQFLKQFEKLDLLINNAGVMNTPYLKTKQGFELQFGVNHLGHFALSGYLLRFLIKTPNSRVVTVSSLAAHDAKIDFNNFNAEKYYDKKEAYKQSKLANLLFSIELNRRFKSHNINSASIAAHPGYARSNLQRYAKGIHRKIHVLYTMYKNGQSARMGALPVLRAAMETNVTGGEYFAPDSRNGLRGFPVQIPLPDVTNNPDVAQNVWRVSEELTGVKFNFNSP